MTGVYICPDSAFARAVTGYLCSPNPPAARLFRRGCTGPGEGWSPAETEHSGEAHSVSPRSCAARCSVCLSSCCRPRRRMVRGVSRDAASSRGARVERRAWSVDLPTHLVAYRASGYHDDDGASDHDHDGAADDDHDGAADHDDDDDRPAATAASADHDDDDCTCRRGTAAHPPTPKSGRRRGTRLRPPACAPARRSRSEPCSP